MTKVPEGYKEDGSGALHRLENITALDLMRDELVTNIIRRAAIINQQLCQFKDQVLAEIEAFIEVSAAEHKKKIGGKKGNVKLTSFDGRFQVQRANHDYMTFDERLLIAKELILECARDWVGRPGVPSELVILVEGHFRLNKNGEVSVSEVMRLMQYPIVDPRWKKAMVILKDSINVQATVTYLRLYERVGKSDKYSQISLDISGV